MIIYDGTFNSLVNTTKEFVRLCIEANASVDIEVLSTVDKAQNN